MNDRTVSVSSFKTRCLALLDDVARTRRPLVVTKRGRPIAQVVAIEAAPSLLGSVTYLIEEDELMAPLEERWDAASR